MVKAKNHKKNQEDKIEKVEEEAREVYDEAADKFSDFLKGFGKAAKKVPLLVALVLILIGALIGFLAGQEYIQVNSTGSSVNGIPSIEYWYTSNATKLTDTQKQIIEKYTGSSVNAYQSPLRTPLFVYKDKESRVSIEKDVDGVLIAYYLDTKRQNLLTYFVNKCTNENDARACDLIVNSCVQNIDQNACKYNKTASDKLEEIKLKQKQEMYASIPKTDKPVVELFVMSHCPFGKQGMSVLAPVAPLFGDKIDASIKFVNYAMHGPSEREDNTKIYCIEKEQKDKIWTYVSECASKGNYTEDCMKSVGVDVDKVNACINETNKKFNIVAANYPKYPINDAECKKYGVRGSPTLVINGKVISDWRTPEKLKTFICAAFKNPPAECNKKLANTATAPSGGCGH